MQVASLGGSDAAVDHFRPLGPCIDPWQTRRGPTLTSLLEIPPPRRLGRYQLLERIAVGGMAEVYKAVALGLSGFEKTVVVKRLLPQHHRDQELLTMFVDEARLLGRLRHPNIAEVYDIDTEGNEYFFALEYVDGVELRDLLSEVPAESLALSDAVRVTLELARALGYAHSLQDVDAGPLGIVHRDISPSNVLISQEGAVKLVDFGVAKWRSQRSETRHGVLKGKVNYMSPEQCRGEHLDSRSDVFALGVLLYEMSVGTRPFESSSDFETLKAIAEGHYILPCAKLAGFPVALEKICASMLELDRERRLSDMSQVANALQEFACDAGLDLDPKALAMKATAAKQRLGLSGQRKFEQSSHGFEVGAGPLRLTLDRTATATATMESFATSKPPNRLTVLWLGALAAVVGTAISLLWIAPSYQSALRARTSVVAPAPIAIVPAVTVPDVMPVTAVGSPLTAAAPTPVRHQPKRNGAANVGATLQNRRASLPAAGERSKANPQLPTTAAVWDPDSPVPP